MRPSAHHDREKCGKETHRSPWHVGELTKGEEEEGAAREAKEKEFADAIPNLFDIAAADALKTMTIAEDRAFLLAQRKPGRQRSMEGRKEGKQAGYRRKEKGKNTMNGK